MSVPDPDYILRVPDHSPISSLQHEEDENYVVKWTPKRNNFGTFFGRW